MQGLIEN